MEYIYKIINERTGKFYVGRSNNVKERLRKHKKMLENGEHDNVYLQRAWNKDKEYFYSDIVEIIDTGIPEIDREKAIKIEQTIIDSYDVGKTIYNLSPSALTGVRYGKDHHAYGKKPREFMGEEGYKKYIDALKKRTKGELNPFYGKKHTPETIELLRVKCAMYGEDNGFYGKKHTKDTIEKLRRNKQCRKVSIKGVEYYSINEAIRETGLTKGVIRRRLNSKDEYKDYYFIEDE